MAVWQAILCGIIYWLGVGNLPFVGLWSLQRPLVCGLLVGCVLGDPVTGAVVGGTINIAYLGFMSAGGSMPEDMTIAGVLGVAYAITGNLDASTALALAIPLSLLGTIVWYLRMTLDSIFVHMIDHWIDEEKYNLIWVGNVLLPQLFCAAITVIPCALAAYYGAEYIETLIDMLSGTVLDIFEVIGGLMPTLGIAITLQYIFKGDARYFFFLSFLLVAYTGLDLLPLGIIGALVAILYMSITSKAEANGAALAAQSAGGGDDYDDDEEEF